METIRFVIIPKTQKRILSLHQKPTTTKHRRQLLFILILSQPSTINHHNKTLNHYLNDIKTILFFIYYSKCFYLLLPTFWIYPYFKKAIIKGKIRKPTKYMH